MSKSKRLFLFLAAGCIAGTLVFAGGPKRRGGLNQAAAAKPYADGQVLVKFKKGISLNAIESIAAARSLVVKKNFRFLSRKKSQQYALLTTRERIDAMVLVNALKNSPGVEFVSPNYRRALAATPNDANFSSLWGLHNIGQSGGTVDADIDAPEAWDVSTGSSEVVVAVIDTGLAYNHPDLAANVWSNPGEIAGNGIDDDGNTYVDDVHGIDPAGSVSAAGVADSDPMDGYGHGTHCAGTIGAVGNNGSGVAGVNWTVKIMGLKFFDDAGSGGYDSDAIECIEYAVYEKQNHGQNVVAINASWGGTGGGDSGPLRDAIEVANDAGIVFCAAAGNGGSDSVGDNNDVTPHYPSSYTLPGIISVAATNRNDALASFSNYGAASVDLAAPGVSIQSTVPCAYTAASGDVFFDNVEGGAGNWVTSGTNNTWAITTNQEGFAHASFPVPSPTHFWSDSPGASYGINTNSVLAYNANINLSAYVGQEIYFGFGAAAYIENGYDHGYVEFSNNGGASWTQVYDFTGFAYYWGYYWMPIPDSFKTNQFRMRFHFTSDDLVQYWGWLIDNIGIGTPDAYGYESWDGTSMATPHVAGAVALLASEFPGETVAQRKSRILDHGDPLAVLSGKSVTGKRLNLYNSISFVAPSTTVTAPNGGEGWLVGESRDITWTSTGSIASVNIDYSINSGSSWTPVVAGTENDGLYEWTVPNAPSATCLVRVSDAGNAAINDASDLVFSISVYVAPTITLISPSGWEHMTLGTTRNITWTTINYSGTLRLVLFKGGVRFGNIANDIDAAAGFYSWTVGQTYDSGTAPEGSDYRLYLRSTDNTLVDPSDYRFALVDPAQLQVTSPNGGESWELGSQNTITWNANGYAGTVRLILFQKAAKIGQIVANLPASQGSYLWTVGSYGGGTAPVGIHYAIRVQATDGSQDDYSDDPLIITAGDALLADHLSTELEQVPEEWLEQARLRQGVLVFSTLADDPAALGLRLLGSRDPLLGVATGTEPAGNAMRLQQASWQASAAGFDPVEWRWSLERAILESNATVVLVKADETAVRSGRLDAEAYLFALQELSGRLSGVTLVCSTLSMDEPNELIERFNRRVREHVLQDKGRLLDTADIESWHGEDQALMGEAPVRHGANRGEQGRHSEENLANQGAATWWLLARLTGWEGKAKQ